MQSLSGLGLELGLGLPNFVGGDGAMVPWCCTMVPRRDPVEAHFAFARDEAITPRLCPAEFRVRSTSKTYRPGD